MKTKDTTGWNGNNGCPDALKWILSKALKGSPSYKLLSRANCTIELFVCSPKMFPMSLYSSSHQSLDVEIFESFCRHLTKSRPTKRARQPFQVLTFGAKICGLVPFSSFISDTSVHQLFTRVGSGSKNALGIELIKKITFAM